MPGVAKGARVKLRLNYEKGSQTFSQINEAAEDSNLYEAARAIASIRKDEEVEFIKIVESDLLGR